MLGSSFKRVLEFFVRAAPDVSGQTSAQVPHLQEQLERFLAGAMTQMERATFFRAVRMNPKAVELLAKEIRRNSNTKRAKQESQ